MNQEIFDLLGASSNLRSVVHKIDADEHEGGKLLAVLLIVLEDDIGILVEEAKLFLVVLIQRMRTFLTMQMAEKFDELVLELTNNGVLQQPLCMRFFQSHISNADAWNGYAHLVLEHGEFYCRMDS